MTQFLGYDSAWVIRRVYGKADPDGFIGPPQKVPDPHDGLTFVPWQGRPDLSSVHTPTQTYDWTQAGPVWVEHGDIDTRRGYKVAELANACTAHIVAGFVSSALGEPHTYPSTVLDQHNLNGLVTRSLYPGNPPDWRDKFWCADVAGVWARRDHSAVQLQQVANEAIIRVTEAQAKCDALVSLALAATIEALDGIRWVE